MKLIFAIKSMDNNKGGAERVMADVTSGLVNKGHEIVLLTFDKDGGESFYALHSDIRRINLGVGDSGKKATILETIKRVFSLRNIIRKENPDMVIAFMHSMFIPLAFSLMFSKIPVIASEHIVPEHYKTKRIEFLLLLISSFFVKKITVISDRIKTSYPKFLHRKIFVIPNPVTKAEITNDDKENIILNVGRLDYQKDQETLIKAFAKIADKYSDWNLRIVGEGDLRGNLEKLIEVNNLGNRVSMPGIIKDISFEYMKSSIFAMTSIYESFGLATVEAMSYGVPAIGFADCSGTNEVIEDGVNGVLVSEDDRVLGFARAMEDLIISKELRDKYGVNAIKTAEIYSPDKIVAIWDGFLKDSNPIQRSR